MTGVHTPRPGSAPARAVEFLWTLGKGTEASSDQLARAISIDVNAISAFLGTALHHQVVLREKREGKAYWRVGPNAPAPARGKPPAAEDEPGDVPDLAVKQVRVDASTAAAPIEGLAQQSWCPVAQAAGCESSLDEPPAPPPPSPAPPPLGLGWKAPRVPVYRGEPPAPAAVLAAAPEPGPAAALTMLEGVLVAEEDPDFQEVRRAPAPPEPDKPPKGAEAAQAPVPPCGRDVATPNNGDVSQGRASEFRCALWSDGQLHIEVYPGNFLLLTKGETEQLVHYLDRMAMEASE